MQHITQIRNTYFSLFLINITTQDKTKQSCEYLVNIYAFTKELVVEVVFSPVKYIVKVFLKKYLEPSIQKFYQCASLDW